MPATAREVMDTSFYTLAPRQTIAQAFTVIKEASAASGQVVFGLMVIDAEGRLVGMLSMYDIFLLIRPKHIHIWGEMSDLEVSGIIDAACQRAKTILVSDVMTTDLITITPDTHVLHIIDIMIKKHVRRLPVLEAGRVIGIVYISRVFDYLLKRLG